ncbi:hypothetical protein BU16DRAFT_612678 [Lophium mytilinum]|uniref:Linalool dehydratase/isomerase domain-containing protein n=1 Tax=Lophium mytilinum TaxID=390894 RepID=A0A6A6RI25_9PEZI|nr:hypothetical protein BU16DRAFT_612678 [Lophium mytilinum]
MDALVSNWETARFCLYACEPNWVYSICNLYGMPGAVVYDRFFKTDRLRDILSKFKRLWYSDFTTPDGSIVALRSGLAGIQMPISGACVTASTAVQCAAVFPEYSDQLWAITKREHTERDENGKTTGLKLGAGDHVDAGLYTMHPEAMPGKTWVYMAAKEKGDRDLASHLAESVSAAAGPLLSDGCGGTYAARNSTLNNTAFANARFNEVVVAKAWSRGEDLDLVLYNGAGKGTFYLSIQRLKPGMRYKWEEGVGGEFVADEKGNAAVGVWVEGRTPVHIKLVG